MPSKPTQHLPTVRRRPNMMNHGERKLALGQILREAFVFRVDVGAEVEVVVPDLEVQAEYVDEGCVVCR